jgi:hypothetical protein
MQEGVVFLPMPNGSEQHTVRVWCPAMQMIVEVKGTVEARCGLETLRVERCVYQLLGCPCLKSQLKRGLCLVRQEMQTGKW